MLIDAPKPENVNSINEVEMGSINNNSVENQNEVLFFLFLIYFSLLDS